MSSVISGTILKNLEARASDNLVTDALTGERSSGLVLLRMVEELKNEIGHYEVVCVDGTSDLRTVAIVALCAIEKKTIVPVAPGQPSQRIHNALRQLDTPVWVDPRLGVAQPALSRANMGNNSFGMYVLFTSGSTGDPKGVKVSQENLLNTLEWARKNFGRQNREVIGLASMAYFDIGLFEILYALYYGHSMVVFRDRSNPFAVRDDLVSHGITTFFTAPMFLSQLSRSGATEGMRQESSLSSVISGGDFLEPATARDWIERVGCRVLNIWGPSETSVVNTVHEVSISDIELVESGTRPSLPIGNLTQDMEVQVVSEAGDQLEIGQSGELAVFGPAVSLGYVTNSPHSGFQHLGGRLCFRTGDLGFRSSEGLLFIQGRSATIIKVGGYRIDPRELEFWLGKLPEVSEVCVVAYTEKLDSHVGVVVTSKGGNTLALAKIRRFLRGKAPRYMLPKKLLVLDALPLNANGKIDRRKISELLSGAAV